jgi:pimeloyl-ACP methyl ester carboxylesterase
MKTVEDYINLKSATPDAKISYGEQSEQFGKLFLPKSQQKNTKPYPTIILLHGGCWRAQHGLAQLGQLSKALTELGYAVWNLEFRRLGNGGGFPITFEDVALGADFLESLSKKYSLDMSNVITMGHSAGGHLALWLAGRHHLDEKSTLYSKNTLNIKAVISLAGIPDLKEAVNQNICSGASEELVGGLPNDIPTIYQQASPLHLLPLNIPQWHLVGEKDPIVPSTYLQSYITKATKVEKSNNLKLEIIPEIGHFEMVMPNTQSWPYIKQALFHLRNTD